MMWKANIQVVVELSNFQFIQLKVKFSNFARLGSVYKGVWKSLLGDKEGALG